VKCSSRFGSQAQEKKPDSSPSLDSRYYLCNTNHMKKHASIIFKTDAETKQLLIEKVKAEDKTVSQWLRLVVNRYVRKTPKKRAD